jgi:hypothetical protein
LEDLQVAILEYLAIFNYDNIGRSAAGNYWNIRSQREVYCGRERKVCFWGINLF